MSTVTTRSRVPLFALMAAVVVGLLGRQLSVIAIPWFVLTTTGSASRAGIVGAAIVLPGFIVGILGGVVVDRLGYRKVSIVSDLVCAMSTLAIPALYVDGGAAFLAIAAPGFLSSLLDIPALTARRSMIPELAEQAGMTLDRANATVRVVTEPGVAGGNASGRHPGGRAGPADVLWLDGGASLVSALIVALAIPASRFGPRVVEASAGYWAELMVGFRFIRRDIVLWPMVIILACQQWRLGGGFRRAAAGLLPGPLRFTGRIGRRAGRDGWRGIPGRHALRHLRGAGLAVAGVGGGVHAGAAGVLGVPVVPGRWPCWWQHSLWLVCWQDRSIP